MVTYTGWRGTLAVCCRRGGTQVRGLEDAADEFGSGERGEGGANPTPQYFSFIYFCFSLFLTFFLFFDFVGFFF